MSRLVGLVVKELEKTKKVIVNDDSDTIKEIKEKLTELQVEFKASAKKEELLKLLQEALLKQEQA